MSKREGQQQVSLWMADHVFGWLEELREYFDVDRATMIKQLIANDYEKLRQKKAGRVDLEATTNSYFALVDKALETGDPKDFRRADEEMTRLKRQAIERSAGGLKLPRGKKGPRDLRAGGQS